jgi:hypothetical protein
MKSVEDGEGDDVAGPGLLHVVLDAAVVPQSQSILSDGRPRQVAAHALHAKLVAGVKGNACVDVDAADHGVGLGLLGVILLNEAERGLARALA